MLVPRYSTTALICDPIFTGLAGRAQWFHNGIIVANVTSTSNAILYDRQYNGEKAIPDVGFLIITNISLDDQGNYWCRREDTGQESDIVQLDVAYIDEFPNDTHLTFHPSSPNLGEQLIANCPKTTGIPPLYATWTLNGERIRFSPNRVDLLKNNSLIIKRFLLRDIGVYECKLSNFAGSTTAQGFIDLQKSNNDLSNASDQVDTSIFITSCRNFTHNGSITWFLIGCLATSFSVLVYLICAVLLIKPNSSRYRVLLQPASYLRSHPNLAPGFRKVISPLPDVYREPHYHRGEYYQQ
ncbi:unnamed protein product [Dracunculus medinensis]|uniref:Ig-like domain-containing protein n=1 Tax=Dracunculus medinensis TaxID=318479 RepID=A0A0N4UNZ3_DRAME|nr:unnamed protein product [Dracunculus medinensis]